MTHWIQGFLFSLVLISNQTFQAQKCPQCWDGMSSFADLQHSRPLAIWATSATVANCPEIITMSWPSSGWKSKIYWGADTTSFSQLLLLLGVLKFPYTSLIRDVMPQIWVGKHKQIIVHFNDGQDIKFIGIENHL